MKWILSLIGFFTKGFWGGVFGYIFGGILEGLLRGTSKKKISSDEIELYLLTLSAIIIKSDGSISSSELNYVRNYFNQMFGEQRAAELFRKFNTDIKDNNWTLSEVCSKINSHRVSYSVRMQMIYFLLGLALSDGNISPIELQHISLIANYLYVSQTDFQRLKAMFFQGTESFEVKENPYKILGISPSSTDAQVKKAYRELAKKYHPDKLQSESETLRRGADEKFRKIQQAYEQIRKEREKL